MLTLLCFSDTILYRSDNTLLGGRTIDYGPFGWMEKYDPMYQVSLLQITKLWKISLAEKREGEGEAQRKSIISMVWGHLVTRRDVKLRTTNYGKQI